MQATMKTTWAAGALVMVAGLACDSGDGAATPEADAVVDVGDVEATQEVGEGAGGDGEDAPDGEGVGRGGLRLVATIDEPPKDLLDGSGVDGCDVFRETRCVGGQTHRCSVWSAEASAFVGDDALDPLFRRVLLYDRWYDLYSSPADLTAERVFTEPMAADVPEEVWGDPSKFQGYVGKGDAAIWTGLAGVADLYRYLATGTEADYARMEHTVRSVVRLFDVTKIPGMLARFHFLELPPGTPKPADLMTYVEGSWSPDTRDHVAEEPETVEGLPGAYFDGVPDGAGGVAQGKVWWHGHPSIDQYTGPGTLFPLAWDLLRDEELKARIAEHMTCYLKRLKRIEVRGLQQNPEILEAFTALFGGGALELDPEDPDLTQVDTLVAYALVGINDANRETYDRSCPDRVQTEPWKVLDATADDFLVDMFELAADLDDDSDTPARPEQIDHIYVPNLRGGDASHLLHYAAMAHRMTGEDHYLEFLQDVLLDELGADDVAQTLAAFRLPDWCFRFYGDHITYGTHWQFITMLADSPLKDRMLDAMHDEMWEKAMVTHRSAKFDVMLASVLPEGVRDDWDAALAQARAEIPEILAEHGGAPGTLEAPRRTWDLQGGDVMASLPEDFPTRCPTAEDVARCEDGGTVLGIPMETSVITFPCSGSPAECEVGEGVCAPRLGEVGLPVVWREYADFAWQRSPFTIGDPHGGGPKKQSPGRDLSEAFWMARYYGLIDPGEGQALGWQPTGEPCGD